MSEESKNSRKKMIVNAPPSSTKLYDGKCSETIVSMKLFRNNHIKLTTNNYCQVKSLNF